MQDTVYASYMGATGNIPYNMTNDYMFHYILQKNEKVLRGLIASLLHLEPRQIKTVEITNPINLNDNIVDKEFILDISILMNDNTQIGLEMQVSMRETGQTVLSRTCAVPLTSSIEDRSMTRHCP